MLKTFFTTVQRSTVTILIVFGIVILLISSGFVYSRISQFRLSEIRLNPDQSSAKNQALTKLMGYLGKPLFSISLRNIESELLEVPMIKTVEIRKVWPNSLKVDLGLHEPVALSFVKEQLWTVSHEGLLIEPYRNQDPLPLLIGFPDEAFDAVQRLKSFYDFSKFFLFLGQLHQQQLTNGMSDLNYIPSEIYWSSDSGITLWSFRHSLQISLGFDHFDRSWHNAQQVILWAQLNGRVFHHLDASFEGRVIGSTFSDKLQNLKNGLNLKELVHRAGSIPTGVR